MEESDYGECFDDPDPEALKEFDIVDSIHNTPAKGFSSLSNKRAPLSTQEGNISNAYPSQYRTAPSTPQRSHTLDSPTTSRLRSALTELSFDSPLPKIEPMRLFTEAHHNVTDKKNAKAHRRVVVEVDDDDDDDDGETQQVTENKRETSLSSFGSDFSDSTSSTFLLSNSPRKKRDGDPEALLNSSPSKQRRLTHDSSTSTLVASPTDDLANPFSSLGILSTSSRMMGSSKSESSVPSHLEEPPDEKLTQFLAGRLGEDLEPHLIAHDKSIQNLLDEKSISWGAQYELARGITRNWWQWSDIPPKIERLRGKNKGRENKEVGPHVVNIMYDKPHRLSYSDVWEEFDREQAAIEEGLGRGLGLMGEWHGQRDWYGGHIQQLARLVPGSSSGAYKIVLDSLQNRRSYKLARFLGSRSVLQLRIPDDLLMKEGGIIKKWLSKRKFILMGRTYVPLSSKEHTAYMVETNEDFEREPRREIGDSRRYSLKEIVQWVNPLDLNSKQAVSKWTTRFALSFSNSMPALEFEEKNIFFVDDECAQYHGSGKPPAEYILTDGCGFINAAGLRALISISKSEGRPTAAQLRGVGSKGMWMLHPFDNSPEPKVWIRNSQRKIKFSSPIPRWHRIFDLVAISRPSPPISISKQSILNLSENGVPDETLKKLMVEGLIEEIKPLMQWDGPRALEMLWRLVELMGNVLKSRLVREIGGLGRVLGLEGRQWADEGVGIESEDDKKGELLEALEGATRSGRNLFSGEPKTIHESTIELLQAGFNPREFSFLRKKIRLLVELTIKSTIDKCTIPLPESLAAFILPDPLGVLQEGEVYYRSSQSLKDLGEQTLFNVVVGDVLVGRYPIRLPSDIQKVKAVDRPQLFDYPDVLIVSIKGKCSFASLLSGGDYDGDDVFIIREKSLVEPFQTKPLCPPPGGLMDDFDIDPEGVVAFAGRLLQMDAREAQTAVQNVLLQSLEDRKFKFYSRYHDFSVYQNGYAHKRSIRLAYMFNTLLDSSKSGLRLVEKVFHQDRKFYNHDIPESGNTGYIFHTLLEAGKQAGDKLLQQYDTLDIKRDDNDQDLLAPYKNAFKHATEVFEKSDRQDFRRDVLSKELERIRKPVAEAHRRWTSAISALPNDSPTKIMMSPTKKQQPKKGGSGAKAPVHESYAQEISNIIFFQDVWKLKASYAYYLKPSFAFEVAFRDLCIIKAMASTSGIAPCTRSFDEAKAIPSIFSKTMGRFSDDI